MKLKLLNRNFYNSSFKNSDSLREVINYMTQRTPLSNIIYIGNIDQNIINNISPSTSLYFVGDKKLFRNVIPENLILLDSNLSKGLPKIEDEILKESIVILDSVIEAIPNPSRLIKDLVKWQDIVPCILISTADIKRTKVKKGWDLKEYKDYLSTKGLHAGFYGYFPRQLYEEKKDILYIGGRLSNPSLKRKPLKVCAIISTYNEEDIIEQVCLYLLQQGIDIHIIDNWSDDNTLSIVKDVGKKSKNLTYELFPDEKKSDYEWEKILKRKIEYAKVNNYDWYIHYDADEIRESCWNSSLKEGIERVDELGFNAVDHSVVDFRPVQDGFNKDKDPEEYFKYFEFGKRPGHFSQVKAWKNIEGIDFDLSSSGGHAVSFEDIKIFPYKFLLKHYPLRSLKHMKKKIYKERLPRFENEKKELGWHTHYDKYLGKENDLKLWEEKDLDEFKGKFYEEFILERIFGINIKKQDI